MQAINFGAGPSILPKPVLAQIKEDIPDWWHGMSIMELSHREKCVISLFQETESLVRELLDVPDDYAVLFMHGGARSQFSAIPLNLLSDKKVANYVITGQWSKQAAAEAQKFADVHIAFDGQDSDYCDITPFENWDVNPAGAYLHYTDNETIEGLEFFTPPRFDGMAMVSDMTSSLLTRKVDFSRYDMIYASAQKNLGIAGVTLVIIKKSLCENPHPLTPLMLSYQESLKAQSMLNTPPVFCIYVMGLVLKWVKAQGGVEQMDQDAAKKSNMLYELIDSSSFYHNQSAKGYRSRLNVPFHTHNHEYDDAFVNAAIAKELHFLKGHRLRKGMRASLYNAMPFEGVEKLIEFMTDFQKQYE